MHRVVGILLFCIVFGFGFGAIGIDLATGGKLQQVESDSQHASSAGRGKPDGPKWLPIALGFKCVHCRNEFDSRHAIDCHRRHSESVGTPCADPRNHKSMSMTERGDQAAGIHRQHDTLGVLGNTTFLPKKSCFFETF